MDSKANAKVSTDGQTGRRLKRIAILFLEIFVSLTVFQSSFLSFLTFDKMVRGIFV